MMYFEQVIENYTNIKPISQSKDEEMIFTTYSANSKQTGQKVVLKETDIRKKELFERIVNQSHNNVCKINNVYSTQKTCSDTECWVLLVEMEYIEGETLAEYIKQRGILNIEDTVDLSLQLCDGLDFLHKNGIIHKDLSISNVMIEKSGRIKIIDFGYSRVEDSSKDYETTNIYTYGSTAPEVTAGEKVDKRADIYSLGKIINFMLTGETYGVKYKGKFRLARIIQKCIKVQPKDRYKNIKQTKKDLIKVNPQNNTITRSRANIRVAVSAAIAFVLGLIFFTLVFYTPEPDNSDKYDEMAKYGQLWSDIYYDMDVSKDYDDAIEKLETVIAEGNKGENISVCYAKCLMGKGEYDRAAEELITYLRDVYRYPNITTDTKESYVLLVSLESKVSAKELEKIAQVKSDASKYIDKWNDATGKFNNKDYAGAIEIIDEIFAAGAKVDVTYFLKMECLLGMNKKSEAKAVYNDYIEAKDNNEGYERVEYDTVDYQYETELYNRVR